MLHHFYYCTLDKSLKTKHIDERRVKEPAPDLVRLRLRF